MQLSQCSHTLSWLFATHSSAAAAAAAAAGGAAAAGADQQQQAAALPPPFGPTELLVRLHALTPAKDGVSNRRLIAAIETALHSPEVFKQEVVAAVSFGRDCC